MRRFLMAALSTAALALPGAAFAVQAQTAADGGTGTGGPAQAAGSRVGTRQFTDGNPRDSSLGGGMFGGNEPGHVESPGVTKIDPESRAPINDLQPGRGTDDTLQSANPKPVR